MSHPLVIAINGLENIHSVIKHLFSARKVPKFPFAGRLKHLLETCKILTKDSKILELVEGYKIHFHKNLIQERIPETPHVNLPQMQKVQVEINNMLNKGAICKIRHQKGEFLSNVFVLGKKDGGNRTVMNMNEESLPYQNFKTEVLYCMTEM